MSNKLELRPYQKECKDILDKTPTGNHLVVMATGLGKTVVLSHLKRNGRVLLLSHRDELVRQPEKYFDCSFGIEKAGERATDEEVVSASVQTLSRLSRMKKFAPDAFDTIIIDEAHHSAAKTYQDILNYFSGAKRRIGFTATPQRGDNVRLSDNFDDIIFNRDLRWGIENNYLSRIRYEQVRGNYKLSKVRKNHGDYSDSELEKVLLRGKVVATAAKAYIEKCQKRHTLIYCVTKKICYMLKDTLDSMLPEEERDTVCVITGETAAEERRQKLQDFSDGKVKAIINCMVLTEGTDLPICDTIISVRPTCNPTLYQQMAGRGTRLFKGKDYCLLIDIVPDDENIVRNLCTAPTLFGIDPSLLSEDQKEEFNSDTDLLKICDALRGMFETEAQRMQIESRSIDLFLSSCNEAFLACRNKQITDLAKFYDKKRQKNVLDYDFGNLDVEICPNEDKHYMITPSWDEVVYISKPDVLDNVNIEFHVPGLGERSSIISGEMKMDEAIELVTAYCETRPNIYEYSWNKEAQNEWKKQPATEKQVSRIHKEYRMKGILLSKEKSLSKLDASRLIDLSIRIKEASKRKKLLESLNSENKKTRQKAKDTLDLELKEEKNIREKGKEAFPEFCKSIFSEKNKEDKNRQDILSKIIPKDGETGNFNVVQNIISPAGKPASERQIGYLTSLIKKAEKYCSLPCLNLNKMTMREVSALINLVAEANRLFGFAKLENIGVQIMFCNIQDIIDSAEENESGKFVVEYQKNTPQK